MEDFASQALPVRLALLSAAAKLFFARPPECQALLGSALAAASADTDQDVHDRGLLYYRCDSDSRRVEIWVTVTASAHQIENRTKHRRCWAPRWRPCRRT